MKFPLTSLTQFFLFAMTFVCISSTSAVIGEEGDQGEDRVIYVLSIDGGGMRGILPGQFLTEVEGKLTGSLRLAECFDLVAGTSTGGLLAMGLCLRDEETGRPKYSAREIKQIYENHGAELFPKAQRKKVLKSIFTEKYSEEPLKRVAADYFGDSTLTDVVTPLLVTSYDLDRGAIHLFTTKQARAHESDNFYLRDIAYATSAAPTYFKHADVTDVSGNRPYRFVDGGVVCNNPALRAFFHARKLYPKAKGYAVLSVGTGQSPKLHLSETLKARGQLAWAAQLPGLMIDGMSTEAQDTLTLYSQGDLEPGLSVRYERLQAELAAEEAEMDNTEPEIVRRWVARGSEMYTINEKRNIHAFFWGSQDQEGTLNNGLRILKQKAFDPKIQRQRFPIPAGTIPKIQTKERVHEQERELDLSRLDLKNDDVRRVLGYFSPQQSADDPLHKLYLTNNKLTEITAATFPEALMTSVYKLQIDGNDLRKLLANSFANMSSLTTLHLEDNQIVTLDRDAFRGLSTLKILYLNRNKIADLPEDVFQGLDRLEELRLDSNNLRMLPASVFACLTSLKRLALSNNKLHHLHEGQFKNLYLESLGLNANYLKPLSTDEFSSLFERGLQESGLYIEDQRDLPDRGSSHNMELFVPDRFL